jgi:RNAse (barnase) inhibitor barstar
MQIIKTIDLGLCDGTETVHDAFEKTLAFPNFYGRNWDALWDAITGLVDMPTNLILYNYAHFANTFKEDADKLTQVIDDYNKFYEGKSVIQLDYLDGIEKGNVQTLLKKRPFQYGLRGDIQLWDDLEASLNGEPMPDNEENLLNLI